MENLKTFCLDEVPCQVLGRTTAQRRPITLFWTGSGIVCRVKASELWVHIYADGTQLEPWVDILIDGALSQRRMIMTAEEDICVFRNMDPSLTRTVTIVRDTPAMPNDPTTLLQIVSLSTDGTFEDVEKRPVIEFIGDSITSGEGLCGAVQEVTWNSGSFSAVDTYAWQTAALLSAVPSFVSQSGWGVYCDWTGKTQNRIPRIYDKICGLVEGEVNENLGAKEAWDFAAHEPKAVVINLGTNDYGSFSSAGKSVSGDGFINPMRMNADGEPDLRDLAAIGMAVYDFAADVRAKNPHAHIVWCYGMLEHPLESVLAETIRRYQAATGDDNIEYVSLPSTIAGEFGARMHPGLPNHEKVAALLAEVLRPFLT